MKKILIIILFVCNYIQDASAQNTINTVPEINLQFQALDTNFIYLGYKNRKRYFLSKDRFTWSEADRNSKSYPNLQLAVITDTATNKFIADSVLKYFSQVQGNTNENIVHIGAKYFKKYNDFRNIDLSPLKFSKWRSGHPVKSIALENMELGIMMFAGSNVNNVYAEWIEAGDLSGWWYVAEQRAYNDDPIPIVYDAYSMFAQNIISKCDSIPARVNFLNQSVNGANYVWNFGDSSQTSSDTNSTHYYNKYGNYKVSLIVKNNFSSDTSFNNIVIGGCPIEYQSFKSNKEYLYPWKGRNIVMLSQKNNLDTAIMNKWVRSLDNAYDYYKNITGKVPNIITDKYYFNLRTIAQVNSTCGAGCGYIGSSGIEYLRSFFDVDYLRILNGVGINHIPFYELGRNFWFYDNKLEYKENSGTMATGFAVFMRYKSMENQPYKFTFESIPIDSIKKETKTLYQYLIKDSTYSWQKNIFLKGGIKGKFYNYSSSDIIASILFRISDNFGDSVFLKKFYQNVDSLPLAVNTQSAIDNLILATSLASNKNLICFFESMKFPISAEIKVRLNSMNVISKPQFNTSRFSFCTGDSLKLTVSNINKGDSLKWYYGTKSDLTNVSNKTFTDSTKLFVTRTDSLGCVISSDTVQIKKYSIPSAPTLSRDTANFLLSGAPGTTWYKDGTALTDTTQKYKPTSAGSYTAKTTSNGCTSVMSSAYYFLVTDMINLSKDEFIKLAPNPFINQLNFDFVVKGYQRLNLEVFDIASGTKVASQPNLPAGTKITLGHLSSGTYVIRVASTDNKISYQFKMLKL